MKRQLFGGATRPFPHSSFLSGDVVNNSLSKQQQLMHKNDQSDSNCDDNTTGMDTSSNTTSSNNVEFMIEFKALKEEVNMTYKVVAELKKEVMELKHILTHKKDKMSTKSQLQEVTIESVQEINENVNEEIDINFNDYLQMLRKKKTHGIHLNQLTDDVWYG